MNCELILIGNELLIGKIQDTNGKWIIDHILPYGMEVRRITTIKDELTEISSTLNAAIAREPDFIFTSGGLGPTFDDMTLVGVAMGLNPPQEIEINPAALEMLRQRYEQYYPHLKDKHLTPSRRKMAELPHGAVALTNREGSAPGVQILPEYTNQKTQIFCLPGVPRELKAIFSDHILPIIQERAKDGHFYQCGFTFELIGESKFTEIVTEIVKNQEYPEIWIKTHPKMKERMTVELHLTSFSHNPIIPNQMRELYERLYKHVEENNGTIVKTNPLIE